MRFSKRRALGFLVAGALGLGAAAAASADGVERAGTWLRSYAGPYDRQGQLRDAQGFAPTDPPRRPEAEEARNPRRWSSEERRQLRNDVHEAGRDLYGPVRRRD
jgi:hypothetical protein